MPSVSANPSVSAMPSASIVPSESAKPSVTVMTTVSANPSLSIMPSAYLINNIFYLKYIAILPIYFSMQIFAQPEKEEETKLCQMTQGGLQLWLLLFNGNHTVLDNTQHRMDWGISCCIRKGENEVGTKEKRKYMYAIEVLY